MNIDIRLKLDLFEHPKLQKLRRRLGAEGVLCLLRLWLWAAANRCDGRLRGLDADDVELAAQWQGQAGALVAALCELRLLERAGEAELFLIHDWSEHQPWASRSDERSARARKAARSRWGQEEENVEFQQDSESPCSSMLEASPSNAPRAKSREPETLPVQPSPSQRPARAHAKAGGQAGVARTDALPEPEALPAAPNAGLGRGQESALMGENLASLVRGDARSAEASPAGRRAATSLPRQGARTSEREGKGSDSKSLKKAGRPVAPGLFGSGGSPAQEQAFEIEPRAVRSAGLPGGEARAALAPAMEVRAAPETPAAAPNAGQGRGQESALMGENLASPVRSDARNAEASPAGRRAAPSLPRQGVRTLEREGKGSDSKTLEKAGRPVAPGLFGSGGSTAQEQSFETGPRAVRSAGLPGGEARAALAPALEVRAAQAELLPPEPVGVAGREGAERLPQNTASYGDSRTFAPRGFRPPSFAEVEMYCAQRGNGLEPRRFVAWCEERGWRVGGQLVRDWRALVRRFEQRERAASLPAGLGVPAASAGPRAPVRPFPMPERGAATGFAGLKACTVHQAQVRERDAMARMILNETRSLHARQSGDTAPFGAPCPALPPEWADGR